MSFLKKQNKCFYVIQIGTIGRNREMDQLRRHKCQQFYGSHKIIYNSDNFSKIRAI